MKTKHRSEENFAEQWDSMRKQFPLFRYGRTGLHFVAIPFLSLLCIFVSPAVRNFGIAIVRFIVIYLPYCIFIITTYMVADRNLRRRQGKKFDQAHLIYWLNNGIGLFLLAMLFQFISVLILIDQLDTLEKEKTMVLVWFMVIDLVLSLVILKFGEKIINKDNQTEENDSPQKLSGLSSQGLWIGVSIIILIIILRIGFYFSGFVDLRLFFLFILSSFGSLIILFSLLVSYQHFFRLVLWRKRNYWDCELRE